jgi:hypothetical protein
MSPSLELCPSNRLFTLALMLKIRAKVKRRAAVVLVTVVYRHSIVDRKGIIYCHIDYSWHFFLICWHIICCYEQKLCFSYVDLGRGCHTTLWVSRECTRGDFLLKGGVFSGHLSKLSLIFSTRVRSSLWPVTIRNKNIRIF